jgi:hypothetical protein
MMEAVGSFPRSASGDTVRWRRVRWRGEAFDASHRRLSPRLELRGWWLTLGHVRVGVVEGVDGAARRDLEVKAYARRHIADGKLHALTLGVPQEQNFVRPA